MDAVLELFFVALPLLVIGGLVAQWRALHADTEHLPRIRGRKVQLAARIAVERRDLLGGRAGDERWLRRIALQAEQLAAVAGRDHQTAFRIEGDVVRRVVARLPQLVP